MTDPPAFERDPRATELDTEITDVGETDGRPWALLRDTILYPEGGGQPADRGLLNGVGVVDGQRVEGGVRHVLESPVDAGPARLELDWPRRFDHMQQHTAQHLLSALAAERFGWATTSFHLGSRRSDIEVDAPETSADRLAELEEAVAGAIRAALPVSARRVSPERFVELGVRTRGLPESHVGDVRLVEIEGVDVTTCGGTHLASTAEIEALAIEETEPMRGGTRIHWRAGGRVRSRLAELEERERRLRQLFETSPEELAAVATGRLEALRDAERALRRLEARLAEARAAALAAAPEAVVGEHFDDLESGLLQPVGRRLVELAPAKAALLTADTDRGALFLLAAGPDSGIDVSAAGPRIAELLAGRGGGSRAIFQGRAGSLAARGDALALLERER